MSEKPKRKRSWLHSGSFSRLKKVNHDRIIKKCPSKPSSSSYSRQTSAGAESASSSQSSEYPQSPDEIQVNLSDNENDDNEVKIHSSDMDDPISSDEDNDDDIDVVNDVDGDDDMDGQNLREYLQVWAVKYNIRHIALKSLLSGLNKFCGASLPNDPRTLLHTKATSAIECMGGDGRYWHQGLESCLKQCFVDLECALEISLDFNIDGLPIHNSSKSQFWPILCDVVGHNFRPLIIAIYEGKSKAPDVEEYLQPFVNELKNIIENGIHINGHKLSVKCRAFICDSPARAYIKGI